MRNIGHLQGEAQARAFGDFLLVQGIENQIEAEKDNTWAVWIMAEEELERSKSLLAEFLDRPGDSKFKAASKTADSIREQKRKEQAKYEKSVLKRRQLFRPMADYGFGFVTLVLIFICVGVYFVYAVLNNSNDESVMKFFITSFNLDGNRIGWYRGLPEIRHGEVWRLVTPIFLHFSFLHIFFNMLWLRDFGSMIESRQNSWTLAILVLVFAVVSNLTQYYLGGPQFGGISGVNYGLFGYIWIRGKLDPGSGLFLHPNTVIMMIVWFFLCFTPYFGDIANGAHTGGLLMGIAWGWLSSLKHR